MTGSTDNEDDLISDDNNGRVMMTRLRDLNRRTLFELFDSFDGLKHIVWDDDLTKQFSLIVGARELQQHGVSAMFPLKMGQSSPLSDTEHVLYLTKSTDERIQAVIDNVRHLHKDDKRRHHLILVPNASTFCRHRLKEAPEVATRLESIKELPIRFYSTNSDVASLLMPEFVGRLVADDWSILYQVTQAIDQLDEVFGPIGKIHFKGCWAGRIVDLLGKKQEQDQIGKVDERNDGRTKSLVEDIILIDRWVDPMTPLVTQLTYEGLIDEVFGIQLESAKFPKEKFFNDKEEEGETKDGEKQVRLSSRTDDLYSKLRDLNFNAVGPMLSKHIKQVSEQIDQRHQATTVREYKEFVKKLPQMQASRQAAGLHTTIAELIKQVTTSESFLDTVQCEQEILNYVETEHRPIAYIEEALAKHEPLERVLRLMCLHSLVVDGLKPKVIEQYRREFLQTYGYDYADLLLRLQKAGLLRPRGMFVHNSLQTAQTTPFSTINKAFRLLVDEVNEKQPNDASYVYSGYAPLTVRLCQYWLHPGWQSALVAEPLKKLAGPGGCKDVNAKVIGSGRDSRDKKAVLVFFIGGITFAEISALRFISSTDENYEFLIASTHIINGNSLLKELRSMES